MADLDIEQPDALLAYLRRQALIGADELPAMHRLDGGVSNRTMLVERESGESWVLKQALAKLRVQVDWFSDPSRVHREAEGIRWLNELAPLGSVPGFVYEDFEHHILIMEAVPQPHENWKTMLLAGVLHPDHVEQFGRMLGEIHAHAYQRRDEVAPAFADVSFFEDLRLEPYYGYTATQVPEANAFLTALIDETRQQRLTLVHGDYSPKNILVYNDRLILLDHEVIHWGDPTFDLGFSLTHLLSKAHHIPEQGAQFVEVARLYWRTYVRALGDLPWAAPLEARAVRNTLGCLLARVAGRSPLEYMDAEARARQRNVVCELMANPPATVDDLSTQFASKIPEQK